MLQSLKQDVGITDLQHSNNNPLPIPRCCIVGSDVDSSQQRPTCWAVVGALEALTASEACLSAASNASSSTCKYFRLACLWACLPQCHAFDCCNGALSTCEWRPWLSVCSNPKRLRQINRSWVSSRVQMLKKEIMTVWSSVLDWLPRPKVKNGQNYISWEWFWIKFYDWCDLSFQQCSQSPYCPTGNFVTKVSKSVNFCMFQQESVQTSLLSGVLTSLIMDRFF